MSYYVAGADLLGASPGRMIVKSADAGVWSGHPDEVSSEVAFTLQPGDEVDAVGSPKKTGSGVEYVPVSVPGREGSYWMRGTSIAPKPAPSPPAQATAQRPVIKMRVPITQRRPPSFDFAPAPGGGLKWWHVAGAIALAGGLGLAVKLALSGRGDRTMLRLNRAHRARRYA